METEVVAGWMKGLPRSAGLEICSFQLKLCHQSLVL